MRQDPYCHWVPRQVLRLQDQDSDTISVIIPTHNRAGLLRRALASVQNQTRRPDEVIVIDDGSTDETAQVVCGEFPRYRYVRQPRRGVAAARNKGAGEAMGRWLAFLDSDDEWRPAKLERQLAALASRPDYSICHTDEIWIRNGRRVNPKDRHAKAGGHIFRRCLALCFISPSAVVIARSLFDSLGGFDETLVVKYGGHSDQLSKKYFGMDRFRIQALENILAGESLTRSDRAAAVAALREKIDIYLEGARKRGKWSEVSTYEAKRRRYAVSVFP